MPIQNIKTKASSEAKLKQVEFGDFQTPAPLARAICALLKKNGIQPAAIIEPTCGNGAFIGASIEFFDEVSAILGFDINPKCVARAQEMVSSCSQRDIRRTKIQCLDFFAADWQGIFASLPAPVLVIGNPPWVTSAALSRLNSNNHPPKSNIDKMRGIEALTGYGNFDIAEWIIWTCLEQVSRSHGTLAMLCKTTTARKVLMRAWRNDVAIEEAAIYKIDANVHFGVSVDAGLLIIKCGEHNRDAICHVYPSIDARDYSCIFGVRDDLLVADIKTYEEYRHLRASDNRLWRSGVKHDCRDVFVLAPSGDKLVNGMGEPVDIEERQLFPTVNATDINARRQPHRWIILPQREVGEDTSSLTSSAPRTWFYLNRHAHRLDKRKSAIYKKLPRFSVFGIGWYSFAPWKVAVSGMHKKISFVQLWPHAQKPVVPDDTCYFIPCPSEQACHCIHEIVMSRYARRFWESLIFWEAKRPITSRILNALDLTAVARLLNKESEARQFLREITARASSLNDEI